MRRITLRIIAMALFVGMVALAASPGSFAQEKKPNIVFIMGDDIGWMQPSIYHRGLMVGETPNIDRIGNEGAIFMAYYAEQSCTAGRNAFFTGMHPLRTGMIPPQLPGSPSYLRPGTNNTYKTPGQAFTDEWGVGQILPLKKDFSKLLQLGVIGYDQWQVTANGGTIPIGPIVGPANILPYYSVHAVGGQVTYILPVKHLSFFFKYEHEYKSYSATLGNTIVFGGAWTLAIPNQPRQSRREDQARNEVAGREERIRC